MKTPLLFLFAVLGISMPSHATNKVLSLDGDGDFLSIQRSYSDFADFSFEAWVNTTNSDTGDLFSDLDVTAGHDLRIMAGSTKIRLIADKIVPLYDESVTISSIQGQWVHMAWVFTSQSTKIYLNDIETATLPSTAGNVGYHTNHPAIGSFYHDSLYPPQNFFQGELDEISIWNRALTQVEIGQTMFNSLSGTEPGLVSYWNFDDGTARDITGNGFNANFAGNATLIDGTVPEPASVVLLLLGAVVLSKRHRNAALLTD